MKAHAKRYILFKNLGKVNLKTLNKEVINIIQTEISKINTASR